ncbi:MAG: septum formation inhibitor Maf [Candidatus Parabeggiatoa sp. nov. 3]|nr:MAG: septum formation inhibitor Maf [Gammaproteobacteria bacterium]RKZ55511.1 MAG: septum formation inhibitor Maf [Gammaproteobacteria bacterium]RKZ89302.1 MAG: septum formation inhibitor Maf [Gammaproteobacteria bacterium]
MIYLASLSKRRCELLDQIKVNYQQIAVSVDETPYSQESVPDYVRRLALTKARAGRLAVSTACPVLGADTVIVYDKQLLGKPVDEDDARRMLRILSGNKHQVMTAVAVVTPTREKVRLSISRVHFRRLSEADIQAYIKTGEPLDKAGSYAIQGLASIFIKRLEGSYSGVMGLPLYETANLLTEMGIKVVETD